ncbi:MAG: CRISPR-associated endonuclease Cas3'', partial [Methylococcales bacterium]|nr:CRISPR-associated endonuclease Cas3'' [Methylococcales bacterium]
MIRPKSTVPKESITNNALPLSECLAKTYGEKENKQKGRDVLTHCQIVGEVARELLKRMPDWLREALFPEGSILIAACHDVGKVCPTFQKMLYDAVKEFISELKNIDSKKEKDWGGHAYVSFVTAKKLKLNKFIRKILGQHHGSLPTKSNYSADSEAFGGEPWQQRREELIEELKKCLDCDFPEVENQEQSLVLAGLTSVSDWIGSQELFDNPVEDWKEQGFIQKAVNEAGFIKPDIIPNLTFFDIFNFHPHDTQTKFFENTTQAGVYILEAPMGLGKTEAALYAAYQLLVANKATGIYFALPTQLTSDKIYDRFNDTFLSKILSSDSPHREALLAHGNAWLKQTDLGENANPDGVWFDSRKRKLLAPFAVGTVDQALMAVMNVRHGFVRTFGLAGKVVILDEVHSYDAYTGTILDELVKALRKLHCTVIILSATLTKERREKLLEQPVKE